MRWRLTFAWQHFGDSMATEGARARPIVTLVDGRTVNVMMYQSATA